MLFDIHSLDYDEKLLRRWLLNYAEQHGAYEQTNVKCDELPRPRHFEASFGMPNPPADKISTSEPLELVLHDERVKITGRIDRIDVGMTAGRAVFTMQLDHYDAVPQNISDEIQKKYA